MVRTQFSLLTLFPIFFTMSLPFGLLHPATRAPPIAPSRVLAFSPPPLPLIAAQGAAFAPAHRATPHARLLFASAPALPHRPAPRAAPSATSALRCRPAPPPPSALPATTRRGQTGERPREGPRERRGARQSWYFLLRVEEPVSSLLPLILCPLIYDLL
jgi:hypothetical protein